jgi:hypothetical protein
MAHNRPDLGDARVCGCEGVEQYYRLDDVLARSQQISDLFIFLSYFSIPLELLYFLACSKLVFPFKWIIVQFGAFIVLCGLTHLVAMWTYHEHTYGIALTQTIMKVLTAVVSCATALTLVSRCSLTLVVCSDICSSEINDDELLTVHASLMEVRTLRTNILCACWPSVQRTAAKLCFRTVSGVRYS